jgi:hypothetical protein
MKQGETGGKKKKREAVSPKAKMERKGEKQKLVSVKVGGVCGGTCFVREGREEHKAEKNTPK